jgi:arginyl-tRNA--protein-N-Asp/Glu arginylyltransferase
VARRLQHLVEDPRRCPYLEAEQARLEVDVLVDVTPSELDAMLERGWRRFGPCYFRPACAACSECVSLRLPAASFAPTRSQRRAARKARRLRRVVSRPTVDPERIDLYARWHAERETARRWPENPVDAERYALDFAFPHPAAREVAYYDDGDGAGGRKIVGLGLFDETPRALSAAFFIHDPAYHGLSLGTANVVLLVEDARRRGLSYVYLGYRVMGCASLRYKANFGPHELLVGRPRFDEPPTWRLAPKEP